MDIFRAISIVFSLIGILVVGSCMMVGFGTAAVVEKAAHEVKKAEAEIAAEARRYPNRTYTTRRYEDNYRRQAQHEAYDYKQNQMDRSNWQFGDPGMKTQ
jgi:hypothetical protein